MLLVMVLGVSLVAHAAFAAPTIDSQSKPQVIRYDSNTAYMPNYYSFHYDASDGSSRTEEGGILNPGTNDAALNVNGAVRWYNSKGQLYEMIYKAGKRGYNTIIRKVRT